MGDQIQTTSEAAADKAEKAEKIDAINQVFSLFRINYHNQFYAAYNDTDTLNQAKRLWLQSLATFQQQTLLMAARDIIEQSEYLPTLHRFLAACDRVELKLPAAREAYLEACNASTPLANHAWSHPLVYHAAKATGWNFLRSETEKKTLPVFSENFARLAKQLREGQRFEMPALIQDASPADEAHKPKKLSAEEGHDKVRKLKASLALEEAEP
ncbi:MAG: hypothetical protein HKO06_01295 [Pseudomonadales bacterium]|nr:hypothetical protein [Pseudomonadales bacterium]